MNRKVLVVFAAMIAATVLVAPVLAAPNDNAWYTVPAHLASNQSVTYAELTHYCLEHWGLSANPYLAPPTPIQQVVVVGGVPHVRILNGSAYYIFTLAIGDDVYEGVSCNILWIDVNTVTQFVDYRSNAFWYLGKWGEQNAEKENGFVGHVVLNIFGWVRDPATGAESWDYMTGTFDLEGFGRFNHHALLMTVDTSEAPGTAGYCTVLGNRHKP